MDPSSILTTWFVCSNTNFTV